MTRGPALGKIAEMARNSSLRKLLEDGHITVKTRKSLGEETADTLRDLILLEKLAPGTSIPERDLAELLGLAEPPCVRRCGFLKRKASLIYHNTPALCGQPHL